MVSNLEKVDPREVQMLQQYLNEFGQEIEAYSAQLQMIEQRRLESLTAVDTISTIKENPENTVLLQLGGGASIKVKPVEKDVILLNIGSDVVVEKSCEDTASYLADRAKEMEALEKKITESISQMQKQANDIAKKIESAYKQMQE
ncbi:prefoldin subunit alpha [Methanomicrobium antiquum]|uniref:Prefoldin subunit alpha n=1 Tax=Methanomicrobium antiquum TaxID=487686 RepID=A0AAF0FQ05_9EURY|nr:prefoldin subunit alpha [Methanomicrobium antiquum]MDD3976897.1 prefoldin subunit alpha [Methanomicrobium sp.]WFN37560.1 prefoldin subunit alpha [Methanomicrobium antiquum]